MRCADTHIGAGALMHSLLQVAMAELQQKKLERQAKERQAMDKPEKRGSNVDSSDDESSWSGAPVRKSSSSAPAVRKKPPSKQVAKGTEAKSGTTAKESKQGGCRWTSLDVVG